MSKCREILSHWLLRFDVPAARRRPDHPLGRPIDVIARNDAGAHATRDVLSSEFLRGRDRLEGKKVVVWEFAIRELAVGDWTDSPLEMKELGAKLIVVPVPPKCAVVPFEGLKQGDAMMYLKPFYEELRAKGIEVLDLYDTFAASKEPVYCKQDAHWNQVGIKLAVKKLAELSKLEPGKETFEGKDEKIRIVGDLMLSLDKSAQPSEELSITKYAGKLIDESSPVLILGDSHTLFLSSGGDMLAENAGLAECLASELKMPVDRIGVKGSASTVVRTNLYRKATKDAAWIKNKKVVIWCFSAREFTESTSGWVVVPVIKK